MGIAYLHNLKLQKLCVLEKLNRTVSRLVCFPLWRQLQASFLSVFPYVWWCLSNTRVMIFAQSMFNMEMTVLQFL